MGKALSASSIVTGPSADVPLAWACGLERANEEEWEALRAEC